jgi:hypothetical protein
MVRALAWLECLLALGLAAPGRGARLSVMTAQAVGQAGRLSAAGGESVAASQLAVSEELSAGTAAELAESRGSAFDHEEDKIARDRETWHLRQPVVHEEVTVVHEDVTWAGE